MGNYGKLAKHGGFQVISGNYLDFQVFGGAFDKGFRGKIIKKASKTHERCCHTPLKSVWCQLGTS